MNKYNYLEEKEFDETNETSEEIKLKKKEIKFLESIFPDEIEPPVKLNCSKRSLRPRYIKCIEIKLINKNSQKNKGVMRVKINKRKKRKR